MARIGVEFHDSSHLLKIKTALLNIEQRASVFKYNDQFRSLILEVSSVISGRDLLLA